MSEATASLSVEQKPVALVTGGATGIGRACSRALAELGYRVVIHCNTSTDSADALANELHSALVVQADLSDSNSVDALVVDLKSTMGQIDVLVNNAGLNVNGLMPTMTLEDYDSVSNVGRGTWYLTKSVVRRFMLKRKSGRIINISSVVGHTGNPGQVPYTMTKASLDALTKSLAQELGERGILVNSVAPGFIDTGMTEQMPGAAREGILQRIPLGRMGRPEEVADVVAFLATRANYITGSVVHVNGGLYGG